MDVLECGHVAYPGRARICRHLMDPEAELNYVGLLTGQGVEFDLCCEACDKAASQGDPVDLRQACEGCVERNIDDDWNPLAWRGEPGVNERPEPFDLHVRRIKVPARLGSPADVAPLDDEPASRWLVLTPRWKGYNLTSYDADSGALGKKIRVRLPAEPSPELRRKTVRPHVHVSRDGRFAAVVNDYGKQGVVMDLAAGRETMRLDRAGSHPEQTPFPLAFVVIDGRLVVAHATEWNRLDLSDPATGELLTAREFVKHGDARFPEHYLDYFHGALHPSPTGRWLADDGWVWQPVGIPRMWDTHQWLQANRWESEDGPSLRNLCQRGYCWDIPMCWIGEDLLAVSGIGPDVDIMLDGVRVFDAETGAEVNRFAGPAGRLFADARRMYAVNAEGCTVWDPYTGERTGTFPGLIPTHYHAGVGELTQIEVG